MLTGLSSIGLSGTPGLDEILDAMYTHGVTQLNLQPSEAYGFLADTSSVWGNVTVNRASGGASSNRNSYIYIQNGVVETGMFANDSLRNFNPSMYLGSIDKSEMVDAIQSIFASRVYTFSVSDSSFRSSLSGGDTTNSMRGIVSRTATDQNDYLVYTASALYLGRINDSGTVTSCRKATLTNML